MKEFIIAVLLTLVLGCVNMPLIIIVNWYLADFRMLIAFLSCIRVGVLIDSLELVTGEHTC